MAKPNKTSSDAVKVIKLQVAAGTMAPTSALGSILGPAGINMMEFLKSFNEKIGDMDKGTPIPVVITVGSNKKFSFITKKPPVSFYIKKSANLAKGSTAPGREIISSITAQQVKDIAAEKMQDLNAHTEEAAFQMVAGSARSMGIKVSS